MTLRLATLSDLDESVDIGREFWEACDYKTPYNPVGVADFLRTLIDTNQFLVYELDGEVVGVAGLLVTPFHFDPTLTVASEVFWYVRPGLRTHGVGALMLDGMENIARREGATWFSMGTMYDPKADLLLEKSGYTITERTYTKVL
jgi:GNAT superfamily N-acetyltransferase